MRKMNKTQAVIQHLQERGSITQLEAWNKYRASRLSAIIYNLRNHYNMDIRNETIYFTDIYGDKSHCDKYVLVSDGSEGDA